MRTDYYAGALMALIGAFVGLNAMQLQIGTLLRMGPGMFPNALSIILIVLGLLIALNAGDTEVDELDHLDHGASAYPDLRGCAAILGGMLAFVILTPLVGIVAGTFTCVFLAAVGDRASTWLGSFVLSAVVTVFGMIVFIYLLKMNLPLFKWFTP